MSETYSFTPIQREKIANMLIAFEGQDSISLDMLAYYTDRIESLVAEGMAEGSYTVVRDRHDWDKPDIYYRQTAEQVRQHIRDANQMNQWTTVFQGDTDVSEKFEEAKSG